MLSALRDLLLPQICALCGQGNETLCATCRSRWSIPAQPCGRLALPVFATHAYDIEAAHVIAGAKDHRRRWLLPLIVDGVLSATRPLLQDRTLLVPIPSRALSVRLRGEAIMERIALSVMQRLKSEGHDVAVDAVLRHSRSVADQSRLSARDRQRNLEGAFAISRRAPIDRRIIVVDDVMTTGASMREAWRALSGYDVVGGACAASTSLR